MGLRPNTVLAPVTFPTLQSDPILRGVLAWNTPGVGIGTFNFRLCRVAAGSEILGAKIKVATAFVGATAATVSMGSNPTTFNNIIAAVDVTSLANSTIALAAGAAALEFLTDTDIFMQLITTVAAPTAGLVRGILDISTPLQGTNAPFTQPGLGGIPITPVPA